MENQGGRNGVPARGGGRRGRSHNHPEPESPGPGDAAGDGHGRPTRNGEERNGRREGGGGGGGRGGRHNGDAEAPRLVGPACESQVRPEGEGESTGGGGDPAGDRGEQGRLHNKEESGSGGGGRGGHRGSHSCDALQEIPLLGSRGGQPGRRGGEQPAALQRGGAEGSQVAGFLGGGVDGGDGERQERHCVERNALCAAVEPEARAAPQVTPTLLPRSSFLSVAVLSWTIKDILDEGLYKNKVLIALEPHPSLVIPFVWLAAYSRPRRAVQLRRLICSGI